MILYFNSNIWAEKPICHSDFIKICLCFQYIPPGFWYAGTTDTYTICIEVPLTLRCKLNMSGLFFIISRSAVYSLASCVYSSAWHHVISFFFAVNIQPFLKQQPDLVTVEILCVLTCLYTFKDPDFFDLIFHADFYLVFYIIDVNCYLPIESITQTGKICFTVLLTC